MWLVMFQEEHYEEEDGEEEDMLRSSFPGGRTVEVFDPPETEAMFMPFNMDSTQMGLKFQEVFHLIELPPLYIMMDV